MLEEKEIKKQEEKKFFSIAELGRELKIPLVLTYKLVKWGFIGTILAADGTIQISESELNKTRDFLSHPWTRTKLYWKSLGPGLITGASDDDPSGIATYSSVGAKFGLGLLWLALWLLPMMMAIQEACARIGIVTNKGLTGVLLTHYKRFVVGSIVSLLIIANIANIGADIGAMAASLQMLVNVNFITAAVGFAVIMILLEIFVPYEKYFQILKWLSVILFAYIITAIIIHPSWLVVGKELLTPKFVFSKEYIFAMIAFFGTTITPYLFFWQTSSEVEEGKNEPGTAMDLKKPSMIKRRMVTMRNDVKSGMIFSNIVTIFIIVTTAEVLFKNGITSVDTAEQAAKALQPLAGNYAYLLFAFGIIGMGFMAVPILAGACAYALSELMGWKEGLGFKFSKAKGFYIVITLSVLVGLLLNFAGVNPITALYYAAWLNGVIALPLMIVIMTIGNNKKIMGQSTNPLWVTFFGWFAVLAMGLGLIASVVLNWGPWAK